MTDPLAEIVTMLQPSARLSKLATGAGTWRVERSESGTPFYCVLLEGSARLAIEEREHIELHEGDFVLMPAARRFSISDALDDASHNEPLAVTHFGDETRHGDASLTPNARLLVGHFEFGSPDAALLVSLLPDHVYVRGERRFAAIIQLLADEARADLPGRDAILSRLLEVMLVEALRSKTGARGATGLLRGLADTRLSAAIRLMHERPTYAWTVELLAQAAALSRSAFFERFRREVGVAPMEYLMAWRMTLAKNLLRRRESGIQEIAQRVGYGSASAFSVAFSRFVGVSPTQYAAAVASA